MYTERVLRGEKVILRNIELSDCHERYLKWLRDYRVNRYLETRHTEQAPQTITEFVRSIIDSEHSWLFAIIENSSREHIGNIKIGPVHKHYNYADVSYFIGEEACWGCGYGTEAVKLVVDFGFRTLKLHRLQAGIIEANAGSGRVPEKAGFVREGCLRKEILCDGRWQDHIVFGQLNPEWEGGARE